MAEIIDFPNTPKPLPWTFTSKSSRVLQALKFLFKRLSTPDSKPKRMIVIYEMWGDANQSIYYLNLGYMPDEFDKAVAEIVQDIKKHPDNWTD